MSVDGVTKVSSSRGLSMRSTIGVNATTGRVPSHGGPIVGRQSGLPILWSNGIPRAAEATTSRRFQLVLKRALDVTLTVGALLLLLPLLIIVAMCIRITSDGPVLFRQVREGYRGQQFVAYKFRTMWMDMADPSGVSQTLQGDTRVTPLGRFLRRTSIDELPQLLNVLKGDMSLVGPRPHVPGMRAAQRDYRELVPYYDARLEMVPGLTGWAQANGLRGPTDDAHKARARIDHDIAYVQNFSLWLDVKILVKTVVREFITGSGH